MRLARVLLLTVLFALVLAPSAQAAAAKPAAFAVTVSPVRLELAADPDGSIITSVAVTNAGTAAVKLSAEVVDFTSDGEQGKPKLVAGTSPASMSKWVKAQPSTFELKPGEKMMVAVTIAVPKKAEPGGHYAAVLFSSAPGPGGQTAVVAKVGTLVLLSVSGEVREAGDVSLLGRRFYETGPVAITARFANTGNVHVKPTGSIGISRLWGSRVASLAVGGENVLPDGARLFDATWKDPQVGVYVAKAALTYGSSARAAASAPRYIVVFPWKLALAGLAVFALGVASSLLMRRKKA